MVAKRNIIRCICVVAMIWLSVSVSMGRPLLIDSEHWSQVVIFDRIVVSGKEGIHVGKQTHNFLHVKRLKLNIYLFDMTYQIKHTETGNWWSLVKLIGRTSGGRTS